MSQSALSISNEPGANFRADVNTALQAIASQQSGASAPATTYAYQLWYDTTNSVLKMRNGANSGWVTLGPFADSTQIIPFMGHTTIASASTCDLGTINQTGINITGTTTITAFGSTAAAGTLKFVTMSGALTLTYNATSLIIPGAANILTAAGDTFLAEALGSGNWRILSYQKANGGDLSMSGPSTTVASATTTDLNSANNNSVVISGTTTITSFGSNANINNPIYFLRFSGILTLTYNATSLIIPGAANILTAAGDTATAEYLGSGNWRVLAYNKANGQPNAIFAAESTLASATTTDLGTSTSNLINVTGTTTITALGSSATTANPVYITRFTGALILTHNATSLIMPGAANYTTAAGDVFIWKYEGSNNWRCVGYMLASGKSIVSTGGITNGTMVASTSGTAKLFTGIPSTAKRIKIMFDEVSSSGTSSFLIQVGNGSVVTSGYKGSGYYPAATVFTQFTTGWGLPYNTAAQLFSGCITLDLMDAATNKWVANGAIWQTGTGQSFTGGDITLGGTLDRVNITMLNGTDTFDNGNINISYE